jgi:hypothetical protein
MIRITSRLEPTATDSLPTAEELHQAIETLSERLDSALELSGAPGPRGRGTERELDELVETYRPRQVELIDLLRADGEISAREASLLRGHLGSRAPLVAAPSRETGPTGADRLGPAPRSVPELIATYQIASLKQAGAVRARRQISFAEYMALKRHFGALESAGTSEG